jgi:hypothetical protein
MHHEVVWTLNLLSIAVMIAAIALNHSIVHQRGKRRDMLECARLRAALRAELEVLHEAYRLNIESIDRKEEFLISTRGLTPIYKANLGRLTVSLDTPVLEVTISFYANNEMVEELLSTYANGKSGLSYKMYTDKDLVQLRRLYELGMKRIIEAREALDEPMVEVSMEGQSRTATSLSAAR